MKNFWNFLFFSIFVLISFSAAFLPLSFLRWPAAPEASLVLGEAVKLAELGRDEGQKLEAKSFSFPVKVFPGQKTYYNRLIKVQNRRAHRQTYYLEIVEVNPRKESLRLTAYFDTGEGSSKIALEPNGEAWVSLWLEDLDEGLKQPQDYFVRVLLWVIKPAQTP